MTTRLPRLEEIGTASIHHKAMDEGITAKELEQQASPLKEGRETVSTQNPLKDKIPLAKFLSSGSSSELDIQQPPTAVNHQDNSPPSPRASDTAAAAGTIQDAASSREENTQRFGREDSEESESEDSLSIPESTSPPSYPQNPARGLTDDTATAQALLDSLGYGYGLPTHQLFSDPRNYALGQLTAAAQLKLSSDSLGTSDNQGRKRPFQESEEDEEDEEWYHQKKKKSKGKQAERWDHMYERLVKFKDLHGHCLVPNRYPEDPSLGAWVSTQRRHYKILMSGDPKVTTPMTPERASRLMAIGFKWATKDPRHVPWEVRFQELLEYKEKYGDCVVPIGFKKNPRLSNWVSQQRQEYKLLQKGRKARITPERVQALNAVGFVWEAQRGCNKRKKKRKKKNTTWVENNALDAAATALQSRGFVPPQPPTQPGNDIPPTVHSHVLSLLDAQQKSNEIQMAKATAEAKMVEDIIALQRSNATAAAAAATAAAAASAPFPDVARRPSHGGALPMGSFYPASRQAKESVFNDPWARQLQECRDLLTARGISSTQSKVPYQQNIIAKHLVDALRHDINVNSTEIGTAVQRIQGMLSGQANTENTRRISQNEAQNRVLRMPQFVPPTRQPLPPPNLSSNAEVRADRAESQSEASRFGVALQVGEMLKEGVKEMVKSSTFANIKVPRGIQGRDSTATGAPRAESLSTGPEGRMQPARLVAGSHSPRMTVVPTTSKGRGVSQTLGSAPNSAKQSFSSGDAQGSDDDGGGIFSDAEEDEAAVAFLATAIARRP